MQTSSAGVEPHSMHVAASCRLLQSDTSDSSCVALAGLQAEEQEVEVDGRLGGQQRHKRAQARGILGRQACQHAAHLRHLPRTQPVSERRSVQGIGLRNTYMQMVSMGSLKRECLRSSNSPLLSCLQKHC